MRRACFVPVGATLAKRSVRQFHRLRRHLRVNPDFLFLDRTRYGPLRAFTNLRTDGRPGGLSQKKERVLTKMKEKLFNCIYKRHYVEIGNHFKK
ncbi:MAG: hypothetical protein CR984_06240 [Proteobacteria bacterium]|nr:MAG: hypothetical protein CR984_06240 [Pseudomonadota bacterium]PIE67306.1 MAG: hypothetical protein CSA23_04930 [Deltaproteobacteria bacterium]